MLGFRLKRGERVGPGMRRALSEDLARAISLLRDDGLPLEGRVHKVRRILKRDRSLLRVFEQSVPEEARHIRLRLRDAARALAGLREGHALNIAAEALRHRLEGDAADLLAAAVPAAPEPENDAFPLGRADDLIEEAAAHVSRLPVSGGRWHFNAALGRAHRSAKRARRRARATRGTEDLHNWRKRLKDIAHLTAFGDRRLAGVSKLRKRARKAEALLGDDHDLALLRSRVVQQGKTATARFVSNVEIGGRRAKLQKKAFKLGRKIGDAKVPKLSRRSS